MPSPRRARTLRSRGSPGGGAGIGTLHRHFPTRQVLVEAVYVDQVAALSRSANELVDLPPWDALTAWLRRYVSYATTKQTWKGLLAASATNQPNNDRRNDSSRAWRRTLATGDRARAASAVRPDEVAVHGMESSWSPRCQTLVTAGHRNGS